MSAAINATATPAVEVRNLWTRFGRTVVHQGIDLAVMPGEVLGLVGGSGSGKTTLLRACIGLLRPSDGEVRLFGEPVLAASGSQRRRLCRRFGVLFQQGALFSALSVFDNIAFPLRELRRFDAALIADLVMMKMAMVELTPAMAHLMPAELSGGMVKRVALARALALEPELLVLDEPTAGLDPERSANFVRLIRTLQRQLGFCVVMVTHDLATLAGLADRIAALADGRLVAHGRLDEVMAVDHPFIRSFFATYAAPAAPDGRQEQE